MFAKKNYNDQFMELEFMPVEKLTKDQIFFLLEKHNDEGMSLNQSSVPCPAQCQRIAQLEKLLTKKELKQYKKYCDQKIKKMVAEIVRKQRSI